MSWLARIQNSIQNHSEKRHKRNKVRLTSATKSIQTAFLLMNLLLMFRCERRPERSRGQGVAPGFSGLREMAVSSNKAVTFSWKSPCCLLRCYSNKPEEIEVNILPSILHHLPHSFISHSDSPVFALLCPISVNFFLFISLKGHLTLGKTGLFV